MKDIILNILIVSGSGVSAPISVNDTQAAYGITIMSTLASSYGCASFAST